ncbi:MAG TPA: ComEC/Rec2 family competence protein [Gemmatimonadales bacterium]
MPRPPGIAMLTMGYGAGLATGLARFPDPVAVVVVVVVASWLLRDEWWIAALPALAAGVLAGTHGQVVARRSCAARLPLGTGSYVVRAIDPGEGTGRVDVLSLTCEGSVIAAWPRAARIDAGRTAKVSGRWIPAARALDRPDGVLMIANVGVTGGHPTAVEQLRTTLVRRARERFGPRAPLVDALMAGWRGELDPDLKAAFASAGLMHLLAISGFHLACLGGWIVLLLRLCSVPRHPAHAAGSIVMLGYAAFLGWPPAATRAAVLLIGIGLCHWRQRQVRPAALLGGSALVVLACDPWSITSVGGWMSVLGLMGMTLALRWSDRAVGSQWWVRGLAASAGALLATAPIAAGVFGQVAPIGIVLSLVGMPLVAAALPAVAASLLLNGAFSAVAHPLAASANGLLALLETLVRAGAGVPGSGHPGAEGWAAALPWAIAAGCAAWVVHGPTTPKEGVRRISWVAAAAAWVVLILGDRSGTAGDGHTLALLFLDVGQGDAALIRTPKNHWIEVDAGPTGDGWDAGRRVIAPYLTSHGVRRIDLFVLSHAHRDHVGGGVAVVERVPVDLAIEPGELFADSAYDAWLGALTGHHTRWRAARAGTHWSLDGVEFRVIHPPTPWAREGEDLNEDSIVLEVRFDSFDALLMGDAGFVAESAMAATLHPVDFLKVGHHGSKTASGDAFLDLVRPQAAVVSVGRNHYGHPAPETLLRLAHAGAGVWRTDQQGSVTVTTDGRTFTVQGALTTATFTTRH